MSNQISDFAVCREMPVVTKISDECYAVVYRRDLDLTVAFSEDVKKICQLLSTGLRMDQAGTLQEGKADNLPGTEADKSQVTEPDRPQDAEDDRPTVPRKRLIDAPKWKVLDKASRTIEYYGKPVRFAKIRFGILEALINAEAERRAVSYPEIAQVGWGEETDRDVIEATIYQLNVNLREERIEEFISCRQGRMFLVKKPKKSS
jgi:hypothetical protein